MLRLSGAQVTRISESLDRFERIQGNYYRHIPKKLAMEELVEDILKEVLPLEPQIRGRHGKSEGVSKTS